MVYCMAINFVAWGFPAKYVLCIFIHLIFEYPVSMSSNVLCSLVVSMETKRPGPNHGWESHMALAVSRLAVMFQGK